VILLPLPLLLAIALALLQAGDWLTTRIGILSGKAHEKMAIMAALIAKYGVDRAVGGKGLLLSLVGLALAMLVTPLWPSFALSVLLGLVSVYIVIVISNLRVLLS
jgi:hypothetical protein